MENLIFVFNEVKDNSFNWVEFFSLLVSIATFLFQFFFAFLTLIVSLYAFNSWKIQLRGNYEYKIITDLLFVIKKLQEIKISISLADAVKLEKKAYNDFWKNKEKENQNIFSKWGKEYANLIDNKLNIVLKNSEIKSLLDKFLSKFCEVYIENSKLINLYNLLKKDIFVKHFAEEKLLLLKKYNELDDLADELVSYLEESYLDSKSSFWFYVKDIIVFIFPFKIVEDFLFKTNK